MAELETISTGKTTTRWFPGHISFQTAIYIIGAFVWIVIFWKDSRDNWGKTSRLETVVNDKANAEDLKSLREQVNRQYQTQREKDNQQDAEIEKTADWKQYQEGYKKALEDNKIK